MENSPPSKDEPEPEPEPEEEKEEEIKFEDVDQETLDKEFKDEEAPVEVAKELEEVKEKIEAIEVNEDEVEKKDIESSEESKSDLDNWNEWVEAANAEAEAEKITPEEIKERAELLEQYEDDNEWTKAKRLWKEDNPDQNIKDWKDAYLTGRVSELPWAQFVKDKEVLEEELGRLKPDLTEVIEPESYKQNEEQSKDSVWNKIHDKDK